MTKPPSMGVWAGETNGVNETYDGEYCLKVKATEQAYLLLVKQNLTVVSHMLDIFRGLHVCTHRGGWDVIMRLHLHLWVLLKLRVCWALVHGLAIIDVVVVGSHRHVHLIMSIEVQFGATAKCQAAHGSIETRRGLNHIGKLGEIIAVEVQELGEVIIAHPGDNVVILHVLRPTSSLTAVLGHHLNRRVLLRGVVLRPHVGCGRGEGQDAAIKRGSF